MSAFKISSASVDGPSGSSGPIPTEGVGADEEVEGHLVGIFEPLKQAAFSYQPPFLLFGYLYERFLFCRWFELALPVFRHVRNYVNAMTTQSDEERLLSILHAHGQQFLSAFDIPATPKHETNDSGGSEPEEEWTGFDSSATWGTFGNNFGRRTRWWCVTNHSSFHRIEGFTGFEQEDDDFTASSSRTLDVTIFLESTRKQPEASLSAKGLRKSFMSSKVSSIASSSMQSVSKKKIPDGESDDERTNTQNDALLHRLVHTKLLSGSLDPELDLDHAQRRKALAGRVLELAGEAKLGKGESVFRQDQRNKATRRIRDGLIRKQREQEQRTLEEAKNLGNYHPTLKRVYDSNLSSTPKKRRTRGLGMGIGKFVGGTLKLSRDEIASVTGSGKRLRDDGRQGMRRRPR
ncbi:hypothetical protein J3R83DRAFT_987 [Lanmaoa asiatica]|nr:hypothetical protein J3R83DRAFT_987 [Lanmaoa asiatica]